MNDKVMKKGGQWEENKEQILQGHEMRDRREDIKKY